jgi:hypothetical protein
MFKEMGALAETISNEVFTQVIGVYQKIVELMLRSFILALYNNQPRPGKHRS